MTETKHPPQSSNEFRARQPIDLALSAGRTYQSGQTGYIHHHYAPYDTETADTIPVYENMLFALALLRTRIGDSMQEGKGLLSKLFYFQTAEDSEGRGGFPIYLHQYPACRDRHLAMHLLAPLFWVYKDFGKVLGGELSQRLLHGVEMLLALCDQTVAEGKLEYLRSVQYAATRTAWRQLLGQKDKARQAQQELDALQQQGPHQVWCSPQNLGEMLTVLAMVYEDPSSSPWQSLWEFLRNTWHLTIRNYVGPTIEDKQRGSEPQPSIYDLFMGHYSGGYSYHAFDTHPFHLQAALIPSLEVNFLPPEYPLIQVGKAGEQEYLLVHTEKWAYSALRQKVPPHPTIQRRYHPFRLIWGDRNRTHSCVMQDGNAETVDFAVLEPHDLELFVQLGDPDALRDESRDLALFIDDHDLLKKMIAGKAATTFQLGEEVVIETEGLELRVIMSLDPVDTENGQRQECGHLHPGNRPAQTALRGADRFKAFDQSLFLRPLRRSKPLKLKVRIRISERS